MPDQKSVSAEAARLAADARRVANWKRWGPYLADRQWGTVREDYSADGESWEFFPHDHARSRVYRWGEDGLLGLTDRQGRFCLALALWNERDPILKERLFGLTGKEGNHGEDVKEIYFFIDATPTSSYLRALYKYPQAEFPYERLVNENRRRGKADPEFELTDTGVFEQGRYFDVVVEYAKAGEDDVLMRVTAHNRGPESAPLHLLPTFWFRNTWSVGRAGEGYWPRPLLKAESDSRVSAEHASLGRFNIAIGPESSRGEGPRLLFTENETNTERLFGRPGSTPYVKDAFHECVINGHGELVNPRRAGTKAAAHYRCDVPAGGSVTVKLRFFPEGIPVDDPVGDEHDRVFAARRQEADAFYDERLPAGLSGDERQVMRQAYAGLLWSKQFYYYSVREWLEGDPGHPPPASRKLGRNRDWSHLYNRDVISMPDKWEYPWYAAWDLAFHMLPFARIDPEFAKAQLVLFLREWYMHPNGQIPAYEFEFSDVNPPVHAWAAWRVYKLTGSDGTRDRVFLARVFQKLLLNFTWWVNRKDHDGNHIFSGGFLGLDNIGVFDRSKPLPTGGHLEQADGTAWMAIYSTGMLTIALELAREDPAYEGVASKFFEHFVAIADAINTLDGGGLWDDGDGFYYDHLHLHGRFIPLRVRSMVGLLPLMTVEVLEADLIDRLPGFNKRMQWLIENRADLARHITFCERAAAGQCGGRLLLALPSRERLERILAYLVDEEEFLSPFGIRSLSKFHEANPYAFWVGNEEHRVAYVSGESDSYLFGGNSNWRGPVWFPLNYMIIEALERYHRFYGDTLQVECPVGSGRRMNLKEVADEIATRLTRLFVPDSGARPCHGSASMFRDDPHWRDLIFFHEYFDGDTGRGLGASHQTGWTALVARCIEKLAHGRGKE